MWFIKLYEDYKKLQEFLKVHATFIYPFYYTSSGQRLIDILILAEDHRNRFHIGVDILAIFRALYKRITSSTIEGASTIEQQLVRVIIGDYKKTICRKLKEILLAIYIRNNYDRKILALIYLDIAYYGTLYQSLDAILKKYNLSKCDDIDLYICASIVARLKYPEPRKYSQKRLSQIKARSLHILKLYQIYQKNQRKL